MKFMFIAALALSAVALTSAAALDERSGVKLTQKQAEARLIPNNIRASSTGHCTTKSNPKCTSYQGIYSGTVAGVIRLKNDAGVSSITITGGTEDGHAPGKYSHSNGYKVDLSQFSKLDSYIKAKYKRISNRSDGFPRWKDPYGNIYCDEGNHWDIVYY